MQTRQNVEKMAKCGDFFSGARGNAKLMINFFLPNLIYESKKTINLPVIFRPIRTSTVMFMTSMMDVDHRGCCVAISNS